MQVKNVLIDMYNKTMNKFNLTKVVIFFRIRYTYNKDIIEGESIKISSIYV